MAYALRQGGVTGLDQQMAMVGHQIVGMAILVEALARCVQDIEELPAVTLIRVDITPGIAACNDMIKRPGKLNAQQSGHDNTSPNRQESNRTIKHWPPGIDQSGMKIHASNQDKIKCGYGEWEA